MVTRVTLDRRGSSTGRTGRFCIAQTALALPGRALFRRSNPLRCRSGGASPPCYAAARAASQFLCGSVQFTLGVIRARHAT